MAMGRESDRQSDLMVTWAEMPRSPGHVFYDRLQEVLIAGGFDGFVETACQPYYAPKMGAPSVPPERHFHMHMVGFRDEGAYRGGCRLGGGAHGDGHRRQRSRHQPDGGPAARSGGGCLRRCRL